MGAGSGDVPLTRPQVRLRVGPFVFVPAKESHDVGSAVWAVPGGRVATLQQLARLARYFEWGKPRPVQAVVKHRPWPTTPAPTP